LLTHRRLYACLNPKAVRSFHRSCRPEIPGGVICFTEGRGGVSYSTTMAKKTYPTSFDPKADIGTDYALIAIGVGAALVALIYLILT
jgi:hypothetical protein